MRRGNVRNKKEDGRGQTRRGGGEIRGDEGKETEDMYSVSEIKTRGEERRTEESRAEQS